MSDKILLWGGTGKAMLALELFKIKKNTNKMSITKNNYQRQEGLEIHTKLDTILKSRDKYILVQELLQDPYLVSGRKINLRVYVLVIKDNYSNIKLPFIFFI